MFFTVVGARFHSLVVSRVLCILTRFQVLAAPESWSNYFFQPFSTFFVDFKPFSVLKSTKNVWKWTKKCFFFHILPAPHSWSTCKSWSTPWGGTSKSSFFSFTFFNVFCQFSTDFTRKSLKLLKKDQNWWFIILIFYPPKKLNFDKWWAKLTKKISSTSFQVLQAPEGWSIYTTNTHQQRWYTWFK